MERGCVGGEQVGEGGVVVYLTRNSPVHEVSRGVERWVMPSAAMREALPLSHMVVVLECWSEVEVMWVLAGNFRYYMHHITSRAKSGTCIDNGQSTTHAASLIFQGRST